MQKVTFCMKAKVSFVTKDLCEKHPVKVASVPLCHESLCLNGIKGFLKMRGIDKPQILSRFFHPLSRGATKGTPSDMACKKEKDFGN